MTVLSEINKITYIGSLAQTLYPIPFEYVNTDNIKVSVYTSNDEFVEDWTFSTQYVIEGGNVKVLPGYEIDDTKKLFVLRSLDIVQDNKYREGGDFPAKSTELSFDKLTMIAQQHQEVLDRCVKVEVVGKQKPEELLNEVYSKLDSATEIAGNAISAANQAQTAADNAIAAVNSAEQTLVQTQAYVDSAKVEINNTKNTAINMINSTVAQAKADVNSAIDEATMDISNIVSDAEGSITNIAVTEANKAIANAAQEATDTATANVNNYVNGTILPPLQTYVDQAQEDANSAATSMEQAALSATAASNYASNASADADNAAESAGLAANSASEAALHNLKNKITNCITEIPQDIKLELNNGTLTLKAGSKVYVPNGFESGGTTPKFDTVTVPSDFTFHSGTIGTSTLKLMLVCDSSGGFGGRTSMSPIYSGATSPGTGFYLWYDTANNLMKISNNSDDNWVSGYSLPVGIYQRTNGNATAIDKVFNGFGYIGSTIFALPGVKGLIPNGRNADGSLKNIEWTANKVITSTLTLGAQSYYFGVYDNNQELGFYGKTITKYDEKSNTIIDTYPDPDVIRHGWSFFGEGIGDSNNKITSFTQKTAFHAVDWNDIVDTANITDNSSKIATTAFVNNKFQVVSALPSSPTAGVFYFVKE